MSGVFDGQVALVTGGSSGLGRAAAVAFAAQGARVVVASRRSGESEDTVRSIREAGGDAVFIKADVSIAGDVEALVAKAVAHYGALHVAFNNAGIEGDPFVRTADYSEETWDRVVATNLKGVFLSMKYELPHLIATRGAIVNMASVAGLKGGRIGVAYLRHQARRGGDDQGRRARICRPGRADQCRRARRDSHRHG